MQTWPSRLLGVATGWVECPLGEGELISYSTSHYEQQKGTEVTHQNLFYKVKSPP